MGQGGLPIGLIPGATYQPVSVVLKPQDRLFLMSDGLTECPSPTGQELGTEGLIEMLQRFDPMPSANLLEALVWDLANFAGSDDFPDDVSGLLFDYDGD